MIETELNILKACKQVAEAGGASSKKGSGRQVVEEFLAPKLEDGDTRVTIVLDQSLETEFLEELFGGAMRHAMARGGRKLALNWSNRIVIDAEEEQFDKAVQAMNNAGKCTFELGALCKPLHVQIGCRAELLQDEQLDAEAVARLCIRGIATRTEGQKMRNRLSIRIRNKVFKDDQPQTAAQDRPQAKAAGNRAAGKTAQVH